MTKRSAGSGTRYESNRATRRTLLVAAIGTVAVGAPAHWRRPLIDTVLLPAHAQTSPIPLVAFSNCAPETLADGETVSFTLSETSCSTGADGIAFLTASCAGGVTTLNIAPGIQWGYVSSTPAANPIVVASGTATNVSLVVENLVTGRFYSMAFGVSDDGASCSISEILISGPFSTAP